MPGFLITNMNKEFAIESNNGSLNFSIMHYNNWTMQRLSTSKFCNDKLFMQDDECILITEGVVVEKRDIISEKDCESLAEALKKTHKTDGSIALLSSQGWSGAYYDKSLDEWEIFTNPYGDHPVFYYCDIKKKKYAFSSEIMYIKRLLDICMVKSHICDESVYDLLTFGYNVSGNGDNTLILEIKRLLPGYRLRVCRDGLTEEKYFDYNVFYQRDKLNDEEEWVDRIDTAFRKAVERIFNKSEEYGYSHLCALSGGLDSRMSLWVAKDMGYRGILSETFCQSMTDDQRIAEKITSDIGVPWVFKSLDSAEFLSDISTCVNSTYGLIDVSGTIHEESIMKILDLRNYGVLCTGQLGDAILGGSLCHEVDIKYKAYSHLLFDRYSPKIIDSGEESEIFYLRTRGFNSALCAQFSQLNYIEPLSPFLDKDVLRVCLSMPINIRRNHNIYFKWIRDKYPRAASYVWENTGARIGASSAEKFLIKCRKVGFGNIYKYALKKSGLNKNIKIKASKENMNPYDWWYDNRIEARESILNQFQMERDILDNIFPQEIEMKRDINYLFENGGCREKVQALSVMYGISSFFVN